MDRVRIPIPQDEIERFCRRWKITSLELFGSALRDDFGPESDVDVLVTFSGEATWSLIDQVKMEEELGKIFGRPVDTAERDAVERSENYIRRNAILSATETIYAE